MIPKQVVEQMWSGDQTAATELYNQLTILVNKQIPNMGSIRSRHSKQSIVHILYMKILRMNPNLAKSKKAKKTNYDSVDHISVSAKNTFIDLYRHANRGKRSVKKERRGTDVIGHLTSRFSSPSKDAMEKEMDEKVQSAIQNQNTTNRMILEFVSSHPESRKSLAKSMKMSESTLNRRINRLIEGIISDSGLEKENA